MTALRLLLDLGDTPVQNAASGASLATREVVDLAVALTQHPDAVAALLLPPTRPIPRDFPAALCESGLLAWSTLAAVRELSAEGPLALCLLAPFSTGLPVAIALPEHVVRPGIPLVVLLDGSVTLSGDVAARATASLRVHAQRSELVRAADLVLVDGAATRTAVVAAGVEPSRVVIVGTGRAGMATASPASAAGVAANGGPHAVTDDAWHEVAASIVEAVANMVPRRPPTPTSPRRRVALVGPMPPDLSGIADVDARLARALAERCSVDVFSPHLPDHAGEEDLPARRLLISSLGSRVDPASYDLIVYAFGNSEHHLDAYDAALRWPGLLHLHDVRLGGFHREYERSRHPGADGAWMRREIRRQYPLRTPMDVTDPHSRDLQQRNGLGLTGTLVRRARAVMVNSRLAERLLRLDQGPDAPLPPIHVGFVPGWAEPTLDTSGRQVTPPLIGIVGVVDGVKAPERVIDAMPAIHAATGAELILIGPVWEPYRLVLAERAEGLGVGHITHFTGEVAPGAYRAHLRRLSCAVALRTLTNGESSGAVADLLSVGVPIVTNMLDAEELPGGPVVRLPWKCGPSAVAAAVAVLLANDGHRSAVSQAAYAAARMRTYAALADIVLGIADEVAPLPRPRW